MIIGLSLSFCVADIINGLINRDSVDYIIAGTRIRNGEEFKEVLDKYAPLYWSEDPELGKEIATVFYNRGMVLQPRIIGGKAPHIANSSHWLTSPPTG